THLPLLRSQKAVPCRRPGRAAIPPGRHAREAGPSAAEAAAWAEQRMAMLSVEARSPRATEDPPLRGPVRAGRRWFSLILQSCGALVDSIAARRIGRGATAARLFPFGARLPKRGA